MKTTVRIATWVSLGLACVLLAGCVERTQSGDESRFKLAWWVMVLPLLIGMIPAGFSTMLFKRHRPIWGVLLVFLAVVIWVVMLPGFLRDYALVTPRHFEGQYGFWFSPTQYNIRYADLQSITHVTWTERDTKGRVQTKRRIDCRRHDGQVTSLHLGDVLRPAWEQEIRAHAEKAGVSVGSARQQ